MRVALRVPCVHEVRDARALATWGIANATACDMVRIRTDIVQEHRFVGVVSNIALCGARMQQRVETLCRLKRAVREIILCGYVSR